MNYQLIEFNYNAIHLFKFIKEKYYIMQTFLVDIDYNVSQHVYTDISSLHSIIYIRD